MKNKRIIWPLITGYIKTYWPSGLAALGMMLIFALISFLNRQPITIVLYALLLCFAMLVILAGMLFPRYASAQMKLWDALAHLPPDPECLPMSRRALEQSYRQLVLSLAALNHEEKTKAEARSRELNDYYTLWIHQIKTPISALDLMLQSPGEPDRSHMAQELFKIQQYAQMVLQYLRLDTMEEDLDMKQIEIDTLVKRSVKNLKSLFIGSRVKINLEACQGKVLTDEKWLLLVIEQALTNAVKYTPQGGTVTISVTNDTLCIQDTGIGIRGEDIPRVFQRGFTGQNGRVEDKSTGIGLYLCHEVMVRLGHTIRIESQIGAGTAVYLGLGRDTLEIF